LQNFFQEEIVHFRGNEYKNVQLLPEISFAEIAGEEIEERCRIGLGFLSKIKIFSTN